MKMKSLIWNTVGGGWTCCLCLLLTFGGGVIQAADPPHVLIVVGPSSHPPGSHEVAAGGRLMKHCLEKMANVPRFTVDIAYQWPDQQRREAASTVVFIGDTFPPNRLDAPDQRTGRTKISAG
jgi:hypothetical protein